MIIVVSTPPEYPSHTPLPWVLQQDKRGNFLIGKRGDVTGGIARVIFDNDAMLIFRAVHAYHPMLAALQMVKASLGSEASHDGRIGMRAHFDHEQYVLIKKALAIAESEVES